MVFPIHQHESAIGIHVSLPSWTPLPPPSPSHLSGFECSASRIKLALVIYFPYDNIHVSTLFSQIIPPSPSPTESKSLFSVFPLLPLHHSRATLLLSGGGAQLKASPASHSPRPYTDAEGTRHFVLSYWLILISCCTRSWRLHSIQTDIPTPLLLHKTCLLHCHHLQNSNNKNKTIWPQIILSLLQKQLLISQSFLTASHSHYNHI